MAAGIAALTQMRDTPDLYPRLNSLGDRLAEGINRHARQHEMPVTMMNAGSMFHLRFADGEIRSSRDITNRYAEAEHLFYQHLQERGVLVPGIHLAFLSAAHTEADIDAVIDAVTASLDTLRNDGMI
jgi:glutamate-1-semialdehyde 2,1-aminomutase